MILEQSAIHASLEKLRLSGAAFALPSEVARSLENVVGGGGRYAESRHLVSMHTTAASMHSW